MTTHRVHAVRVSLVFSVLVLLTSASLAFGQATTGTISGTVQDDKGGVVAGATVSVRNTQTNTKHELKTEADGRFSFPGLPVGPYELTVEMPGFSKYLREGIVLLLNQVAVVNPTLKVATISETITVTEDAPLLNTTNPEVGVRFDTKRLSDLPSNSTSAVGGGGFRDAFAFALSAPGVSQPNPGNSTFAAGTNFSVNGNRPRGNNFMIDGQDSNDPSVTGRQQVMNNPDIVQEFRLITNQFAPEYGRAAGSIVSLVTKSGTNQFHGTAHWYYDSNVMNSRSNSDKAAGALVAPFYNEHQFGGTAGGPILKDKTFFFGSLQRWTIRQRGSGTTISGAPTAAGKQVLQNSVGSLPQVAALLQFLPAANGTLPSPRNETYSFGGNSFTVPLGTLSNFTNIFLNNWQASGRIDQQIGGKHNLGGRYLFNDTDQGGVNSQATPPGLTTINPNRQQALTTFLTSNFTPRTLNELRLSWQRLANTTTAADPSSQSIPSIEITTLGLTGFNAATSRTAIGLAVNLPQFRFNNTYQLQENLSLTKGPHALKFGIDFRRIDAKSFFLPTLRGRLAYDNLQAFVNDIPSVADINKPLPGGATINYYKWYDYFFFFQDSWAVRPSFSLTYGLRYEAPGNALSSLYPLSDNIADVNGGNPIFLVNPRPGRDLKDFQPRLGFSWNPRFSNSGVLGWLGGRDELVVRGGYARAFDYQFINLALNVASSFPFLAASSNPGLVGAFTALQQQTLNLSNVAAVNCALPANTTAANCLTRTVLDGKFRSPVSDQFSLEIQRQIKSNNVVRIGYVGTKGTHLFQTLDGNPRTLCSPVPMQMSPSGAVSVAGCPRLNPNRGVIRLRANAASSIYHSLQISYDRRFANGLSAGAHYTWSAFIDDISDTFNPSPLGEVALAQNAFNRTADRARSTFDRPHRVSGNVVYELPFYRSQAGGLGRLLGGWQIASFVTFQSGSPWTPLNGSDPTLAEGGISGLVGEAIRPNLAPGASPFGMSSSDVLAAGGAAALFQPLPPCARIGTTLTCQPGARFGNVGRNILRSDRLKDVNFSISKTTRITETHKIQLRLDMFDATNTRNYGIPQGRISSAAFARQTDLNGGNRTMYVGVKYIF